MTAHHCASIQNEFENISPYAPPSVAAPLYKIEDISKKKKQIQYNCRINLEAKTF